MEAAGPFRTFKGITPFIIQFGAFYVTETAELPLSPFALHNFLMSNSV
jgi:hypothetical protein